MEGYVTVLTEMESAATLPVLSHSGSTMPDGPSDLRGLKMAMLSYSLDMCVCVQPRMFVCCSVC